MLEEHLSTRELAERLHCHPETILRAAQRGELRSVRLGNDRRYSESAVREWLERRAEPLRERGKVVRMAR